MYLPITNALGLISNLHVFVNKNYVCSEVLNKRESLNFFIIKSITIYLVNNSLLPYFINYNENNSFNIEKILK